MLLIIKQSEASWDILFSFVSGARLQCGSGCYLRIMFNVQCKAGRPDYAEQQQWARSLKMLWMVNKV